MPSDIVDGLLNDLHEQGEVYEQLRQHYLAQRAEIARLRAALELPLSDEETSLAGRAFRINRSMDDPYALTKAIEMILLLRCALNPEATEGLTLPPRKNKTLADDLPGSY